jgi:hypothetical protein
MVRFGYLALIAASAVATALYLGQSGTALAATATYDFEAQAPPTSTPFSVTNNGVTASFSSPADPGGFTIFTSFFSTLTGNVLLDPGPAGANDLPLTVGFSQPIDSISLLFALNTGDPSTPLTLVTDVGGSKSATGVIPPGFSFPEGALSFIGPAFSSVTLSTSAMDLAVDDIVVTTAAAPVPEPGTWSLVSAGLGALAFVRRRKLN